MGDDLMQQMVSGLVAPAYRPYGRQLIFRHICITNYVAFAPDGADRGSYRNQIFYELRDIVFCHGAKF